MEDKSINFHPGTHLIRNKVFEQGTKHVAGTAVVDFVLGFKQPQKSLDHGPNAVPGSLAMARCTCLPQNGGGTSRSLELEQGVHCVLVLEVRGGSVSVEIP
jgi:hypothetical protein